MVKENVSDDSFGINMFHSELELGMRERKCSARLLFKTVCVEEMLTRVSRGYAILRLRGGNAG